VKGEGVEDKQGDEEGGEESLKKPNLPRGNRSMDAGGASFVREKCKERRAGQRPGGKRLRARKDGWTTGAKAQPEVTTGSSSLSSWERRPQRAAVWIVERVSGKIEDERIGPMRRGVGGDVPGQRYSPSPGPLRCSFTLVRVLCSRSQRLLAERGEVKVAESDEDNNCFIDHERQGGRVPVKLKRL
jgi:hypothetical protein